MDLIREELLRQEKALELLLLERDCAILNNTPLPADKPHSMYNTI